MQYSQFLAIFGLAATALALPNGLTGGSMPEPTTDGGSVSCSSGNVYCVNGEKDECSLTPPGQQCDSGSVRCCDSDSFLLSLDVIPICSNTINVDIPVTVSLLDGDSI